ncbi:hypothetical protein MKX01_024240 [Papaver californicum]|nr:hypothetical protein MKX01_024240 [Papaver californicum]
MGSYTFYSHGFILNLENYEVDGMQNISKEEDLELERQLKILNKPPVKIVFQPVFDHPLLKNHKTQIKRNLELKSGKGETSVFQNHVERCSQGTIPIRRTRKEDLFRAKYLPLSSGPISNSATNEYVSIYILCSISKSVYGDNAKMSKWNPNVTLDQYSLAEISLRSGWDDQFTRIHVNPIVYDNDTTTIDNGDQTGCYNTLCLGFVQVNQYITPDQPLNVTSVYDGDVVEMKYHIYLVKFFRKKWWFVFKGATIGYWQLENFPLFSDIGVKRIYWGGHSMANGDGHVPKMGSGHFSDKSVNHVASFSQI